MRINWVGYYPQKDGYGRFSTHMVRSLQRMGVDCDALLSGDIERPEWMLKQKGISWDDLTISCLPPYELAPVPRGRHWLFTMTEGSHLPDGWADIIAECNIERVIVPCQANAESFRAGGVTVPIHVVPGGTDPHEFPLEPIDLSQHKNYTFLALADRGPRKGWLQAWKAFYQAFGTKTAGDQNVRLILKYQECEAEYMNMLAGADNRDPRIEFLMLDSESMRDVYARADCIVLPSRYEGWGMPHREAAMMGLPVITQCHSGLDDGHTEEWAYVVGGKAEIIPVEGAHINGYWYWADVDELAAAMRFCYDNPMQVAFKGQKAAKWLRQNQTWMHSARRLMELVDEFGAGEPQAMPLPAMQMVTGG